MTTKAALVLGAASPLGAALSRTLDIAGYTRIILTDYARDNWILREIVPFLGLAKARVTIGEMDPKRPFAGLSGDLLESLAEESVTLFHLAHKRDRRISSSEIRAQNPLLLERALSVAYRLPRLMRLVVVTDVGLVGDYPGRFSENWIDVGQKPFDEVDKTSIEVERVCGESTDLSIIRARVGLYLGPGTLPHPRRYWRSAQDEMLGVSRALRRLPGFLRIPMAVSKEALAPLTPVDWAADVIERLAANDEASGKAFHLVLDTPPTMARLLEEASQQQGGPRISGGMPVNLIAKLGFVPGFKEATRRYADEMSSWWTPHRYCLSRNDLDTANLHALLPDNFEMPSWQRLRQLWFKPRR